MSASDIILKPDDLGRTGGEREGRAEFMLTRDIVFELGGPRSGVGAYIPAGFVFDRYSVPLPVAILVKILEWRTGFTFKDHILPAGVHDWLYAIGKKGFRATADRIFREAMRESGVPASICWVAWAGVRFGGWRGYGKITAQNAALIQRARVRAFHTWADDQEARYAGLLDRLNGLRSENGLPPLAALTHMEELLSDALL